jgi:hypothetical protein
MEKGMIVLARFIVNVSDELSATLDTVGEVTEASRSDVLAILIRVHTQQLIRFMSNRPNTMDGDHAAVTVEEIGDSIETQFLEACAKDPHELELLMRVIGLTDTPHR